jgi:hypothetical protein
MAASVPYASWPNDGHPDASAWVHHDSFRVPSHDVDAIASSCTRLARGKMFARDHTLLIRYVYVSLASCLLLIPTRFAWQVITVGVWGTSILSLTLPNGHCSKANISSNSFAQTLVPELLSRIFHLAVGAAACPQDVTSAAYTLLKITWVCWKWRAVALSSRTLWARTMFIQDVYRPEVLMAWRNRSHCTPFDLRISDAFTAVEDVTDSASLIHSGLSPSTGFIWTLVHTPWATTMQSLHVNFKLEHTGSILIFHLFSTTGGYVLPSLRTLSFRHGNNPRGALRVDPFVEYDTDDAMSRSHSAATNSRTPSIHTLKLANLNHVHLTEKMCSNMLLHCSNITTLVLDRVVPRMEHRVLSRPILLPNCKELWISPGQLCTQPRIGILGLFDAPNVVKLTLVDLTPQDFVIYMIYAGRMHPGVRILRLEYIPAYHKETDPFLAGWLYQMPLIEELHINYVDGRLLQVLQSQTVPPPVLDPGKTFAPEGVLLLSRLRRVEMRNITNADSDVLAEDIRRSRARQGATADVLVG